MLVAMIRNARPEFALAAVLVLVSSAFVGILPGAGAQSGVTHPDFVITDYAVGRWDPSEGRAMNQTFVTSDGAVNVWVNVTNNGDDASGRIPVIAYADNPSGSGEYDCRVIEDIARGEWTTVRLRLFLATPENADEAARLIHVKVNDDSGAPSIPNCPDPTPETSAGLIGDTLDDNSASRHVIVDYRFNWQIEAFTPCAEPNLDNTGTCEDPREHVENEKPWNRIRQYGEGNDEGIGFQFRIVNAEPEGDSALWYNKSTHPDGGDWPLSWRITYRNLNDSTDTGVVASASHGEDDGGDTNADGVVTRTTDVADAFLLLGRGGEYVFELELDTDGEYRVLDRDDLKADTGIVNVRAPDLQPGLAVTGPGATPDDPARYEADGSIRIPLRTWLNNTGDYQALNMSEAFELHLFVIRADPDPAVEEERIRRLQDSPHWSHTYPDLDAAASDTQTQTLVGTDDPEDVARFIGPGTNKIIIVADPVWTNTHHEDCDPGDAGMCDRGLVLEVNESNNRKEVYFFVENTEPTELGPLRASEPLEQEPGYTYTLRNVTRQAETFTAIPIIWEVDVTEDDANVDVRLHLQRPDGSVTNVSMTRAHQADEVGRTWTYRYVQENGYPTAGEYRAWVTAKPSGGPLVNSTFEEGAYRLTIKRWPIHSLPEAEIIETFHDVAERRIVENGTTYAYSSDNYLEVVIAVPNNAEDGYTTGYKGEENATQNKFLRSLHCNQYPCTEDELRDDTYNEDRFGWRTEDNNCNDVGGGELIGGGVQECARYHAFKLQYGLRPPGGHHLQIAIYDRAGDVRIINRTIEVLGDLPVIKAVNHTTSVSAGDALNVTAEVRSADPGDDAYRVSRVIGEFRHNATGETFTREFNAPSGVNNTRDWGNWTLSLPTGWQDDPEARQNVPAKAGAYTLTVRAFDAVNAEGNTTRYFSVGTTPPTVQSAGVTPDMQELNQNVTFYADVASASDVVVTLVIVRGTGEELARVQMTDSAEDPGNFTYERAFDVTGTFRYDIEVANHVGHSASPVRGNLDIVENLPPRISFQAPSYVDSESGERIGGPKPRLQFLIQDNDGILQNSVTLTVNYTRDGVPREHEVTLTSEDFRSHDNPPGVVLTYDFPSGFEPFAHGTEVRVNVSAQDLSDEEHVGYLPVGGQSFVVDAKPPRSLAPVLEDEQYRLNSGDTWNVSRDTVIRLVAEDDHEDPSTEVENIRYRVLRQGESRQIVIRPGEGFSFGELIDEDVIADLGSGPYKITFFATDAVGNRELAEQSFDVVLDDLPPVVDAFATRLQGRFINVTWLDDYSGVERVAAWHRSGEDGVWEAMALEFRNGEWTGVLEEGRRGEQVCYYVEAWDNVGNADTHYSRESPYCYDVDNRMPELALLEPGDEATLRGVMNVRWTASDPDEDQLAFKLYYRLAGRQSFVELASLPAGTSSYTLDTRDLPDGSYDLQVTASDGQLVAFETVRVEVRNRAAVIESPGVSEEEVRPGRPVVLTAVVNKADATVTAIIYRNGDEYDRVPMRDDGSGGDAAAEDGIYSTTVELRDAGTYRVEFHAQYEEGGQVRESTFTDAVEFSVKMTAGDVVSAYAGLWLALVALVAACGGVGGYALLRKWRR